MSIQKHKLKEGEFEVGVRVLAIYEYRQNLDYLDLDYLDFFSTPNFVMNIY